jgi:hypothetical protein
VACCKIESVGRAGGVERAKSIEERSQLEERSQVKTTNESCGFTGSVTPRLRYAQAGEKVCSTAPGCKGGQGDS